MSIPTFSIKKGPLRRGVPGKIIVNLHDAKQQIVAFCFSLQYDPLVLSNPREVVGKMAPSDTSLTVNSKTAGALGILLDSGADFSAPGGDELEITFDVTVDAPANTTISFVGQPAPLSTSDVAGNPIKTAYKNATILIK